MARRHAPRETAVFTRFFTTIYNIRNEGLLEGAPRVLHIAPEANLARVLGERLGKLYRMGDKHLPGSRNRCPPKRTK
jgi:hypothetical protein